VSKAGPSPELLGIKLQIGANPIAVPEGNSTDKFDCYYVDG